MEITLEQLGKRFTHLWVFHQLNLSIPQGRHLAVLGRNGSGKSTLLKIIAGALAPSAGKVTYRLNGQIIPPSKLYQSVSYAAPYADLIEDFTLRECLQFHRAFKPLYPGLDENAFLSLLAYEFGKSIQIKNYSSGMKQRIRLALGICSATPVLILDEPGSNLDTEGKVWFQNLLGRFGHARTVIIASNDRQDVQGCHDAIQMEDFHPRA